MKKYLLIGGIMCASVITLIGFKMINSNKDVNIQLAKGHNFEENTNIEILEASFKEDYRDGIDEKDIIIKGKSDARFKRDISDNAINKEEADLIIIGNVNSISGAINLNPSTNNYTIPQTIGSLNVDKIIKGDLSEDKISFIKVGGIINIEEYEKSLYDSEKSKLGFDKLTTDEKKSKYVEEYYSDDIQLERNKEYLMYLKYKPDYERYEISFMQFGLREVKTNSNERQMYSNKENLYDNIDNIIVKNNVTGEWENLNDLL